MSLTRREAIWEGAVAGWVREVFAHAPAAMAVLRGADHVVEFANDRFIELVGDRPCIGLPARAVLADLAGPRSFELLDTVYASGMAQREVAAPIGPGAGAGGGAAFFDVVYQPVTSRDGVTLGVVAIGIDVSDLVHARDDAARIARVVAAEREILEQIISGTPLPRVLDSLVAMIESLSDDAVLGSILLLDRDGVHLRHGAAPSLPAAYNEAIDGIEIGPRVGSCGTAAHRREQVIVEDIAIDPLWADYRDLAARAGLRACWSTPIIAADDCLVGTFAMYYPDPRAPTADDLSLIELLVRTAAVAIERHRADEARDEALVREHDARAEAERANRGLQFVLDVTTEVASSPDYQTTLQRLADRAVPAIADICTIDVLEEGDLRRAAMAAHLPGDSSRVHALAEHVPIPGSSHPIAVVLATGEPHHEPDVTDEVLRAISLDDKHRSLLGDLGLKSFISVPLAARDTVFGVLTLLSSGRRFEQRDVVLALDLARRAGLAISNVALYQAARDAEQRLSLVARAGVALTSSLHLDQVVRIIGELLVPDVGDVCEVHVLDDDGRLLRQTVAGRTRPVEQVSPSSTPPVVRKVLDTCAPVSFEAVPADAIREVIADPAGIDGGLRAGVVVPLLASGEAIGAIAVGTSVDAPEPAIDADIMEVLAGRAALAVHNARLFERQRRTALVLQRSLLPPVAPDIPGVEVATRYQPAYGGLMVGGDFYDFPRLGRRSWGMLLGDVCGKGAEAAALTGLVRYATRAAAVQTASPAKVLMLVNDVLNRDQTTDPGTRFATMLFGRLRPLTRSLEVTFASAGHPLPLLVRRDGTVATVGRAGTLLGVLNEVEVTNVTIVLESGDALVAVTDGVLEARSDDDVELGDELPAVLQPHAGASAATLASVVEDATLRWRSGEPRDDLAVVVLRVP